MSRASLLWVGALLLVAGCGGNGTPEPSAKVRLKSPSDPLAAGDIDRFLAIVHAQGGSTIPEFTPDEGESPLNYQKRATDLVDTIRSRFHWLFDANRQGEVWQRDEAWARSFEQQQITAPEFAALVRSISCAVMRVRLDGRKVDVPQLLVNARAEVEDLIKTMDAIDAVPVAEQTRHDATIRAQSSLRLARAVALREFSELVGQVPPENRELVRKYSKQIKPLLPPDDPDGLLSELQALATSRSGKLVPAGHEEIE